MKAYGYGYGTPFIKGSKNSAEAIAWKTWIEGNGGTITQSLLDIFDTNFFIPAKANGNILSQLDRLNIFCGLVGYEIAARTNIIKNAHYVTPVSSPTFDNNGYKSSGTSYLNLNYNPHTQGVKLLVNDAHFGCLVKAPQFASNKFTMGCQNAAQTQILRLRRQSGELNGAINAGNGPVRAATATSANLYLAGVRTGASADRLMTDGNSTNGTNASTARPNFNMFELTYSDNNSPVGAYDDNYHLLSWCGSSSLDYTAFRTICNNLITALGV